jgi:hypothetical protein
VKLSRRKPLIHIAYALALIAMGCFVLLSPDRTFEPLVGILMMLAGAGLGVRAYLALSDARPKIIMSDEGIDLPGASIGLIGWSEIVSARIEVIRSVTYLHLGLSDPHRSAELHPELRGRLHGREIEFNVTGYDMTGEAISDAIVGAISGSGPSLSPA